jgi:predicted RNase H-like HicB family nuclease
MEYIYAAITEGDAKRGFSVWFPDFPGCVTAGDTLEKVYANAHEVLEFHIEGMIEDGDEIPAPRSYFRGVEVEDKAVLAIRVDVPTRTKRYNVTLPENLVQRIDANSANRSGFLAEAAQEKLTRLRDGTD